MFTPLRSKHWKLMYPQGYKKAIISTYPEALKVSSRRMDHSSGIHIEKSSVHMLDYMDVCGNSTELKTHTVGLFTNILSYPEPNSPQK